MFLIQCLVSLSMSCFTLNVLLMWIYSKRLRSQRRIKAIDSILLFSANSTRNIKLAEILLAFMQFSAIIVLNIKLAERGSSHAIYFPQS